MRVTVAAPALLLALLVGVACASTPDPLTSSVDPEGPPFRMAGVVVIFFGPRSDTLRFSLEPEWRRQADGRATWAFGRTPAPSGWSAFGMVRGDTLIWGLTRLIGDTGVTLDMEGVLEAGAASGCGRMSSGRRDPASPRPHTAAFALTTGTVDAPTAEAVPVDDCRRSG